jgi:hypothetical protein
MSFFNGCGKIINIINMYVDNYVHKAIHIKKKKCERYVKSIVFTVGKVYIMSVERK